MVLVLKLLVISFTGAISGNDLEKAENQQTSMEKRTPPMGEPKATATPAALEAVITSRIFPKGRMSTGRNER